MRNALILLNVLLGCALAYCAVEWFAEEEPESVPAASSRRETRSSQASKNKAKSPQSHEPEAENAAPQPSREGIVERLSSHNIFDPSRCASARVAGAGQSQKLDMRLVGTFTVGDVSGAIILQKQAQAQNRMGGARRAPPGVQEMMQHQQRQAAQQDRMTRLLQQLVEDSREERENRRDWEERIRNRNNPNYRPPEQSAAQRRDARDMRRRQRERSARSRSGSAAPAEYYKQYVRCGETTSNGYTLVSVTRWSATLTRGSEKVELVLLDASENANGRAFSNTDATVNPPFFMGPPSGFAGFPGGPPNGPPGGPQNGPPGGPQNGPPGGQANFQGAGNQNAPAAFSGRNQTMQGGRSRSGSRTSRRTRNQ